MIHPARTIPFDVLWDQLHASIGRGHVRKTTDESGLHLFAYTDACVYERAWDEYTMIARGLILDANERRIVATPFPKFFNVGEGQATIPELPFETFEKLDGSLIIVFHHQGKWKTATKGSLNSDQAQWAARKLEKSDVSRLVPGVTYLCEAIYPENRIVVHYGYEGLVLLGAYDGSGMELARDDLIWIEKQCRWRIAKRFTYSSIAELLELAKALPPSEEGFVLRFDNGLRLKLKGDEYCRIHRLVSNLTPLAMWDAMKNGDDLEAIRRQLPEEFWNDFDQITRILGNQIASLLVSVVAAANGLADLSDKEVGLRLNTFPERVRRFIFPFRKNKGELMTGRTREALFRELRPKANRLEGYRPSGSMNRVLEEAA